jgi:hypothetical protein
MIDQYLKEIKINRHISQTLDRSFEYDLNRNRYIFIGI